MNANPYATPAAVIPSTLELFTPVQVGGATFVGTPLAGAALMAINHYRLGRPGQAMVTLVAGGLGLAFAAVAGVFLLTAVPASLGTVIGLAYMYAMRQIAQHTQGAEVEAHLAAGGSAGSFLEAAGVSILSFAMAVVVVLMLILVGG